MKRSDWYAVYILSIMSGCLIWDGRKTAGLLVLLASVVILVLVDGFGIELGD
jgi:tryptophan-rich sensory protein